MLSSLTSYITNKINPHNEITQQAKYSRNSIPFELSSNFKLFESKYELYSAILPSGDKWQYYDTKGAILYNKPLILIPGTTGTAVVFFQQLLSLGLRGYRLISVTIPSTSTVELFTQSFIAFLTYLNIDSFHLLGTSLGGYLALSFTAQYPWRVLSLILTNSFINTRLFQSNAPWISSDLIPEFYLRRYITDALPHNKQQSIEMALSTAFVLNAVYSLSRDELISRLSLNFSTHCIDKVNYDESHISIIDVYDETALDQGMRDQLYTLLKQSKLMNMKYGGDFPYLSNHEEYTMLIQVHLRRNLYNNNDKSAIMNSKKDDDNAQHLMGCFDHRRQYHNAQKHSLFRDGDNDEHKDGLIINDYDGSDSDQSSDLMEIHHTEHDKKKSLLMSKNGSYDDDDDDNHSEHRIVGIESNKEKIISDTEHHNDNDNDNNVNICTYYDIDHTDDYIINDEKKKQYLMDKKLKKKRYKEYLYRKKKAYKRYLRHKNKDDNNDDKKEKTKSNKKHKKHKKHRKHIKHKEHSSIKKKKKLKHKKRKKNPKEIKESVERRKEQMMQYYKDKKMKIAESETNLNMDQFESEINLEEDITAVLPKDTLDIVNIGSNLISPRHSFTDDNEDNEEENESKELNEESILNEIHHQNEHKKHESIINTLPIHAISEESSQINQSLNDIDYDIEPEPEQKVSNLKLKLKEKEEKAKEIETKPERVSQHRVLRAKHHVIDDDDDLDQTPMDLIPTTMHGHRIIPSYDSTMSVDDDAKYNELELNRIRSGSYMPWQPDRGRQDSFISDIGNYDFGVEGNNVEDMSHVRKHMTNINGYTPIVADLYSSQPLHNKFPSNASLYFVSKPNEEELLSQHKVYENDENVGDSIF